MHPDSNLPELSDEALVELIRTVDKEKYAELLARYQPRLLRYAHYLVHDDDIAADVVQETFIKAYINLNGFDTRKKLSSWIYRIAHNVALNKIQSGKKSVPLLFAESLDSGVDLEESLMNAEEIAQMQDCLTQLPIEYREPIVLFAIEGYSYQEISDILRVPISTIGTRIRRAKAQLKRVCLKKLT